MTRARLRVPLLGLAMLAIVATALTFGSSSPNPASAQSASSCVSDSLLTKVQHYYDINKHRAPGYGVNWKRVLIAFGDVEDSQLKAMTAADAKVRETRWWGWKPVREALECIEAAAEQQDAPPPPPPTTPEISIASDGDVSEGTDASFTVTATPAPAAALTVSVTVSQSGDFASTGSQTVSISTSGSATLAVPTTDDSVDETDGSVTATLASGTGYTVSSSSGAATAAVSDDDVPELSIASDGDVSEGSEASFTITASPTPHAAMLVSVTVSATGAFGVTTGSQSVTIPTSGSKSFTVSTSGDATDEPDGSVTATLGTGAGYTVSSSSGAATVGVSDDDDPLPTPTPESEPQPLQAEETPEPQQAPGTVTYEPADATVVEGEYLRIRFSATAEHYCINEPPDWLTGVTQLGSTALYCSKNNPILLATRDDSAVNEDRTFSISPYTDTPDVSYPAQTLTVTEDDLLVTNIRVVGRTSNPSNAKTAEWNGIELDVSRDYHEGFSAILDASGSASIIARSSKVAGAQFPAQQSGRRPAKYPIHCGSGDGWVTVREDVVNNSDWPQDQSNFSETFPKTRAATGDREKVCPPPPVPAPRPRVVSFSAIQSYGDLVLAGQTLHGDRIGEEMTGYVEVSGSASIIGVASKMFKFTYYEHGDGHELKASAFGPVDSGANEVVRFNCGSGSGWARILYFWKGSSSGDTVPYAPYRRFKVCN